MSLVASCSSSFMNHGRLKRISTPLRISSKHFSANSSILSKPVVQPSGCHIRVRKVISNTLVVKRKTKENLLNNCFSSEFSPIRSNKEMFVHKEDDEIRRLVKCFQQ